MENLRNRTRNQAERLEYKQARLPLTGSEQLEHYISSICECIASSSKLPAELAKQAKGMKTVLESCFEEQMDFSYEFYKIVKDLLTAIEQLKRQDFSPLTVPLLKLGEYMQSKSPENPEESSALTLSSLIVMFI